MRGCAVAGNIQRVDAPAVWPIEWVGEWRAEDGKTVVLEQTGGEVRITVSPGPGLPPYESAELLKGGRKQIADLVAICRTDDQGRKYLEIEAGTEEVGPTYRLYAAIEDANGRQKASDDAPATRVILVPNTSIGLYDDYEDDLGVPWAYPLEPMRPAAR